MATLQRPPARPPWDEEILELLPALHRHALALARNFHAAEDLVHDTVVKAYSCADKFQPGSNLRAWLFTILRNTFYSGMRKQKREVPDSDGLYAATLVALPEHDGRLAMIEFMRAFATLSSEHRDILTLVGVSGHSYGAASIIIGIPVGTAKSRLSRARMRLTETLDATAQPGPLDHCTDLPANRKAPRDGELSFHRRKIPVTLSENRYDRAVKQTTDGRDKGSTTIALVEAGNQKNRHVPCAVRSD